MDWDEFKAAATLEDISVSMQDYAEYVTGYISTCAYNIVPTIQVKKISNQKTWIKSQVHHRLCARSLAFRSGNETSTKLLSMDWKKSSQQPKVSTADSGRMWQGLQHITDCRTTTNTIISTDSLLDDLNTLYTCFETSSHTTEWRHTHTGTPLPSTNSLRALL